MKNKTEKKYKPINCSANVKKNKTIKKSCYDKRTLLYLKKVYNKNNNDKIRSSRPSTILKEIKEKMNSCNREDCWLQEIKDSKMRKQINDYLFAPSQPKEWKKNPSAWLSNYDILNVLKQYEKAHDEFKFIGPTPIDFDTKIYFENNECVWKDLCDFQIKNALKNGKTKIGIVFNLDKHYESGSHWVSMFIDLKDNFIYYFDSALNHIPNEIINLRERLIKQAKEENIDLEFFTNTLMHQYGNNECGMYSLYFMITMLTGKVNNKKKSKKARLAIFNKRIPDKYVFNLRSVYFNK